MKEKQKRFIKTVLSVAIFLAVSNYNIANAQTDHAGSEFGMAGTSVNTPSVAAPLFGNTTPSANTSTDNNSSASVQNQIAQSVVAAPAYSASMSAAGCDESVWNKMVSDYNNKAQANITNGVPILITNQKYGAKPSALGGCFNSAAQLINNAARAYNTIAKFLTGGGADSSGLFDYAKNWATNAACAQINSAVASSSLGTTLNNGVGTVNSGIGTVLNTSTNVGGVNTPSVSSVLNGSGYSTGTGTNTSVSGNGIANSTGLSGVLNNVNPFK